MFVPTSPGSISSGGSSSSGSSSSGSSGCGSGCVVGIIFGSIAGFFVLIGLGVCCFRMWKKRRERNSKVNPMALPTTMGTTNMANTTPIFVNPPVHTPFSGASHPIQPMESTVSHPADPIPQAGPGPSVTTTAIPPGYATVQGVEQSYFYPAKHDASYASYLAAVKFVQNNPVYPASTQTAPMPAWIHYNFTPTHPGMLSTAGITLLDESANFIQFTKKSDANVQTQYPIPITTLGQSDTFYFEVKLVRKARNATVAIGLASKPFPSFRLPGWEALSIGYHSDDGRKFIADPHGGKDYASPFGEGDVIGCGYRPSDGLVFFTKNGLELGLAALNIGVGIAMFPTVGADGKTQLLVNFGQLPFVFSLPSQPSTSFPVPPPVEHEESLPQYSQDISSPS